MYGKNSFLMLLVWMGNYLNNIDIFKFKNEIRRHNTYFLTIWLENYTFSYGTIGKSHRSRSLASFKSQLYLKIIETWIEDIQPPKIPLCFRRRRIRLWRKVLISKIINPFFCVSAVQLFVNQKKFLTLRILFIIFIFSYL